MLYWQWLLPKYSFSSCCCGMVGSERDSIPSWELYLRTMFMRVLASGFFSSFKLHDLSLQQDISQSTKLWVTLMTCFIKARCPRLAWPMIPGWHAGLKKYRRKLLSVKWRWLHCKSQDVLLELLCVWMCGSKLTTKNASVCSLEGFFILTWVFFFSYFKGLAVGLGIGALAEVAKKSLRPEERSGNGKPFQCPCIFFFPPLCFIPRQSLPAFARFVFFSRLGGETE